MINLHWIQQQFPEITELQPLGQGGQKEVFTGRHHTNGDVVLKLFHLHTDEERAMREVTATQRIQSPRVPKIFEIGKKQTQIGEFIWVREARIQGLSLRKRLKQGPLNPHEVLTLAKQILEALVEAEEVNIVHRDVKPDNIILADDGNFWLLDFGVARHLDMASLTATDALSGVGTPGYAPPEQFQNMKTIIDARTDLFALGVTLYECVEGFNPFWLNARDKSEVLRRVEENPLPFITKNIGDGTEFRDFIQALTRRQPHHRPDSAKEALSWIEEICLTQNI